MAIILGHLAVPSFDNDHNFYAGDRNGVFQWHINSYGLFNVEYILLKEQV